MVTATTKAVPLFVSEKQSLFRQSHAPTRGFVGGRGCGKTTVGSLDMLRKALRDRLYMVVSPTYKVMRNTSWREFLRIGYKTGQILHVNKSNHDIVIRTSDGGEAEVSFRSAEDPDALRGPNASGAWLDEASLQHPDVYPIVKSCLREAGELGWLTMTFTPRGQRHWTYELFFDSKEDSATCKSCGGGGCTACARTGKAVKPGTWLVHAHQRDNPWLADEYLADQALTYTTALAQQEISGLFVELAGLMFRAEWFPRPFVKYAPFDCMRVRYWDFASTEGGGCRTAGVLMACDDSHFYVEDVVAGQWSPDKRNKKILAVAEDDARKYRGRVNIIFEEEGGSAGPEQALFVKRMLSAYPVRSDKVRGSGTRTVDHERRPNEGKIRRAEPFAAACENGLVKMVKGDWNSDYLYELCAFPEYKLMDRVDASSGAYNHLNRMKGAPGDPNIHTDTAKPSEKHPIPMQQRRRAAETVPFRGNSRYGGRR